MHCLREMENFSAKNPSFSDLSTKNFNFTQNTLKNSDGNPSMPGHLKFFIFLNA